ncbi:hypothetical protein SeseC_01725 [Streptococcus equi subsp. zooepidemicus ATCC 35246]|nr:hypothetical protein SeseC_01725 [Streptococcus equi subsp. zooepidemicus ATCC 35246]
MAVAPDIGFISARLVLFSTLNLYDCFSQKADKSDVFNDILMLFSLYYYHNINFLL